MPIFARFYAACGLPPVRGHAAGFAGLLRIMCAQQVSAASARALIGRLDDAVRPLTPGTFLALGRCGAAADRLQPVKGPLWPRLGRGRADRARRSGRLIARTTTNRPSPI